GPYRAGAHHCRRRGHPSLLTDDAATLSCASTAQEQRRILRPELCSRRTRQTNYGLSASIKPIIRNCSNSEMMGSTAQISDYVTSLLFFALPHRHNIACQRAGQHLYGIVGIFLDEIVENGCLIDKPLER